MTSDSQGTEMIINNMRGYLPGFENATCVKNTDQMQKSVPCIVRKDERVHRYDSTELPKLKISMNFGNDPEYEGMEITMNADEDGKNTELYYARVDIDELESKLHEAGWTRQ